jgi:serine protease Do
VSIQQLTQELADEFGSPDASGALVGDVVNGSPAEDAGLQRGDIIRQYNGTQVKDPTHLRSLVAETSPGTSAPVLVLRNNSTQELSVAIGELPNDLTAMRSSDRDQQQQHALSGIKVEPIPHDRLSKNEGVLISKVQPDSAAERAGLRRGDIIVELNRNPVRHVDDFHQLTTGLGPQTPVLILLKRGNGTIYLSIKP